MCGLAGIVAPPGRKASWAAVAAMTARLAHRGPDGQGQWTSPDERVAFGHRRLAIIDLSERASQPMTDATGLVTITYNGEIYNHAALRRELSAEGAAFKTDHSDTEVILAGYLQWGLDGLLHRLNGIFAFALYDSRNGATHLVRDPIGVKPLVFAETRDGFAFASEYKALFDSGLVRPRLNPIAAYHYLTFMAAPAPLSLYDGCAKLPAGWLLTIDASGGISSRQWRRPKAHASLDALTPEERIAHVRKAVITAVERQLESDVPVGVFLSGGVDSTAILAIASATSRRRLHTFSVGFSGEDGGLDETQDAADVARRFDATHHSVRFGEDEALAYLDRLCTDQDEPLADWVCLPLHFVADLAQKNGLKTVLVGEGADEQFCGYDHYLKYLDIQRGIYRWAGTPRWLGLGGVTGAAAVRLAGESQRALFWADFLARANAGEPAFWGGAIAFWESMKRPLLRSMPTTPAPAAWLGAMGRPGFWTANSAEVVNGLTFRETTDTLAQMVSLEFAQRLPELLLMRVDKICMASSLEARVPMLDLDLVDLSFSFGEHAKIPSRRPKHLLREALRGIVPDDVLDRKKRGFGAPIQQWLRGPFGAAVRDRLAGSALWQDDFLDRDACLALLDLHRAGQRDYSVYVWTIFNLALWRDGFPK